MVSRMSRWDGQRLIPQFLEIAGSLTLLAAIMLSDAVFGIVRKILTATSIYGVDQWISNDER
jgi:hypothetical protein